jgi:hypothetical protein
MLSWGAYMAGRLFSASTLVGFMVDESLCMLCAAELLPMLATHLRLSAGCYRS